MKVMEKYLRIEPYTSAIDKLRETAETVCNLKKGDKIAQITTWEPYYKVSVEIDNNATLFADHCERVAFIVEGKKVVDLSAHVYKTKGYKNDKFDMDDRKSMLSIIEYKTRSFGNPKKVNAILDNMINDGIVIIINRE